MNQNKDRLEQIVLPLLKWYDTDHRKLPWRENKEPYRIWVSEIMLQQTRVEAVKPYYARFMEKFPTIEALARAEDDALLKCWEGLGYYSRARNLKKAAIMVMEEYQGRMPDTWEELQKLPGIGSYTAGAIASIAFNKDVPAVDGNVLRILSRLRKDEEYITSQAVKKRVEEELIKVMPKGRSGDFNQALMELGATVCIPNGEPKCNECPWNELCRAKRDGCIAEYPKKEPKKKRSIEHKTVLVLKYGENVAIHKRPKKGLLAGLYQLPMLEGYQSKEEVIEVLQNRGLYPIRIEKLPDAVHIFSHKEWHMKAYAVRIDELTNVKYADEESYLFVHPKDTEAEYPIPSAFAAYAEYLNIKLGNDKF